MTAVDTTKPTCPNCGSGETAIGGSGNAICTACLHMWMPGQSPEPPTTGHVDPPAASPDGLAAIAAAGDPETLADVLDGLTGGVATLEGGQLATVVAWKWPEVVIVELGTGDLQAVDLGNVERILPPVLDVTPVDVPETVDDMPPEIRAALELAKIIIRAGAESVEGTGANVTPGMPPTGYLPSERDMFPVIERAAGLAVGILIEQFELDVDEILTFVGAVEEAPEVATETTEEPDDTSPRDTP